CSAGGQNRRAGAKGFGKGRCLGKAKQSPGAGRSSELQRESTRSTSAQRRRPPTRWVLRVSQRSIDIRECSDARQGLETDLAQPWALMWVLLSYVWPVSADFIAEGGVSVWGPPGAARTPTVRILTTVTPAPRPKPIHASLPARTTSGLCQL
ncbi:hypothetical protein H1C71_023462, partial [Ictidomys tridecemlineatus]